MKALILTTNQLRSRPDLVAVNGVLYNLPGFAPHHPGGTMIQGAGAYDASALYCSMHPGQSPLQSKLLQKYRVGTHVRDPTHEKDVIYQYDSPFAKDLLKIVRTSMKKRSWWAPLGFYARIAVIAAATLACEYQFIVTGAFVWAVLIGVCHAQIGLSIQHDASHGAVSKNWYVNDFFAHGADWIGNSKWIWFQQHILWHHPHTNHPELDPDATSAEPLIKFQNKGLLAKHENTGFWHPYQHFLLHSVLSLYGPSIVYNPWVLCTMKHNDNIPATVGQSAYMNRQKVVAGLLRLFYYVRIVVLPWYIGRASFMTGLVVPCLVTGMLLTFVFVVSHNFIGSDRNPTNINRTKQSEESTSAVSTVPVVASKKEEDATTSNDDEAPICWYKAQAETSCTYGGTVGMLLTGGLNLQIEHHLFPRLSSWYYPMIRDDVRACCEKHNVNYAYYPTLFHNMWSMLQYVRKVGMSDGFAALKEHAH